MIPYRYDLTRQDVLVAALKSRHSAQAELHAQARYLRSIFFGAAVELRSVIEYSNECLQACKYCGMNAHNSEIERYTLSAEYVLNTVRELYQKGRRVIVIQSGANPVQSHFQKLWSLLSLITSKYNDIQIIGNFGVLTPGQFKKLRDININRYILKFETSDALLYKQIKPGDSLSQRIGAIKLLKKTGFLVGSGNICGLPGQSIQSIARDVALCKELGLTMASTSVFIPNDYSAYAHYPPGNIDLTLNFIALLRLSCPEMTVATTSSLETLIPNGQLKGLNAGANTICSHDGTPALKERSFVIYHSQRYRPKDKIPSILRSADLTVSNLPIRSVVTKNAAFYELLVKNLVNTSSAVYSDNKKYSYPDIYAMTSRFCSLLEARGLQKGQIVTLALFDSIEFIVSFLACVRLGIVVSIVDPLVTKAELTLALKNVKPACVIAHVSIPKISSQKYLFVSEEISDRFFLELIRHQPESSSVRHVLLTDPAFILFTSGTTQGPKAVLHRYQDLIVNVFPKNVLSLGPKDIVLSCSRLCSSYGLGNSLVYPFLNGAGTILMRNIPNYHSLQKENITPSVFFAVPSMYRLLMDHAKELKRFFLKVRIFVCSGEKLDEETFQTWKKQYKRPLLENYGSTEIFHSFISNIPGKEIFSSCGKVLPGFKVKFGKRGQLLYQGPSLFTEYYKDTHLTKSKLQHGWFHSDDLGYQDQQGNVYLTGRANLKYKHHGKWVAFENIEAVLRQYSQIKESFVSIVGSRLIYWVVLKKGSQGNAHMQYLIRKHCLRHLKTHELADAIVFTAFLPRATSGKIKKSLLEEKL